MGSCIICGADVDGHICSSHEEDAYFEFTGSRPDELTPGRFYLGSVDGFADFGVFVDIGDHVTGLLHTSELDRRLEGLDWDPGDQVFVQVKNVRDNGNIDLGWSIRQRRAEFRGSLIDTGDGDELPPDGEPVEDGGGVRAAANEVEDTPPEPAATGTTDTAPARDDEESTDEDDTPDRAATGDASGGGDDAVVESPLRRTEIDALRDLVGDPVRIEGAVVDVRQTSGPTIFELRDETGIAECAAFESAGVRAYPEIDVGDIVRLDGVVEERRGDVQVETESLVALEGEDREAVKQRHEAALAERAEPEDTTPLADPSPLAGVQDGLVDAARTIRRAVYESRPIVVRHAATADGYLAGAALERAALPLIREDHDDHDAEYHYLDRRPLDGRIYDMGDAMRDTTGMLTDRERHDEPIPLFVFVGTASTGESRDGLDLLEQYGAPRIVIDGAHPDDAMRDAVDAFVTAADTDDPANVTSTALAAAVAGMVNPAVRDSLAHLPAASYPLGAPDAYVDLAADAGYDADATATIREAVTLEAFYQAYEDKRELITDLLFDRHALAERASEQYRERVDRELRTAQAHLERRTVAGTTVAVLDVDAFTHRYEFPPSRVLLAELAAELADVDVVLGADEDELVVTGPVTVDMREVGEAVAAAVPDAGVETRAGRDGWLVFLSGAREAVVDAAVDAVAEAA